MGKNGKRRGDRKDGVLLRDIAPINQIMPGIMPNRADNEAFISLDIDLRPLEDYLAKKNEGLTEDRYTFFHLISAAVGKAFVLRPRMNRFICNNRIYQRRDITIGFVVKKQFSDQTGEGFAVIRFDPEDTIDTYHEKIMKEIHQTRREDVEDTSSGAMRTLTKMPHFVTMAIIKTVLAMDRHGKAPDFLIGSDPNHQAIVLSNLGSIGLECGYHHLVNWGTNSCFVMVGKKHWTGDFHPDGAVDVHEVIPLGFTLDERIADGYYYSGTIALLKEILAHPELLEQPASTPVEYAIHR